MHALKSIVRGFFAIQAAMFLLLPIAAICVHLRTHLDLYLAHSTMAQSHHASAAAAAYGIVAAMFAIGMLFGMAWWTTRKTSDGNRGWAIAASVINVGDGILALLLTHLTKGRVNSSLGDCLLCIGLGAAGIFLFARSEAADAVPAPAAEQKSVAGDRTSALTRHAVTALSCIAQIAAIVVWSRWAFTHELWRAYGLTWILLVTGASVLTTVIHECGHALIAWCFEMSLLSFKAGPFQWVKREGKWNFKVQLAGLLTPGGAVGAVSKDPNQPRWEEILMIAAGPLANLLIGMPAVYAVLRDDWPHYQQTWELVAFTASFCVIAAILNLFPFMSEEGAYSDGARILQIVTNSPLEEYHRAMASIASTATTQRRYRDIDVAPIQRAATLFPGEFRGLHLNLCACHCFEDRIRFSDAAAALASAEAIYNDFAIDLPAPLHTVFVIGHAYLNRDAAAARLWWDRMEAKKNERQNVDYWLARTALLWIEGEAKAAEDAWFEGDALAQALPKFGAYEFDRFRCFLLRQALNEQTDVAKKALALTGASPLPPVINRENDAASSPILPAWITPAPAPAIGGTADPVPPPGPVTRITQSPIAALETANQVNSYSDTASMFARLSSLTAGSAEAAPPAPNWPSEPATKSAAVSSTVEVEPEPQSATNKPESIARIASTGSGTDAIGGANEADHNPFARIPRPLNGSLPDVVARPVWPAPAAPAMWSARSSAPPLVSAPSVTPLPVDAWTSLPLLPATPGAVTSFLLSPVQTPSRGPSVLAAFARKPLLIAPMPENPFALAATGHLPANEPEWSSTLSAEQAQGSVAPAEALAAVPEPIAHEAAGTLPQIVEARVISSDAIESTEVIRPPSKAEPPVPAAVEAPKFDALAFIRAAAMENLST